MRHLQQLTRRQRDTYQFVSEYLQSKAYAPTVAEIASALGIRSRGVVHRYLRQLEALQLISLRPGRHRNIQLCPQSAALPLCGTIAAGAPIESIADQSELHCSEHLCGAGRYALRVRGDSMTDCGILDGDYVICQQAVSAAPGQIVVALIDKESATLKRYQPQQDGKIALHPAHAHSQVQIYSADRVEIQGIYVALLRLAP